MSLVRYTAPTPAVRQRPMRRGPTRARLAPSMQTRASFKAFLWCVLTGGFKPQPATVPAIDRTVHLRIGKGVASISEPDTPRALRP